MQLALLPTLWLALVACLALNGEARARGPAPEDWRVTSIVRTVDLGGTVTTLSDTHVIRGHAHAPLPSSDGEVEPYYFAFSPSDASHLSALEATVKFGVGITPQQRGILAVQDEGPLDVDVQQYLSSNQSATARPRLYSVRLPAAYLQRAREEEQVPDITVTVQAHLFHTSEPLPLSVGQKDSQFLLWRGDASPIAVYDVEKARVKVK